MGEPLTSVAVEQPSQKIRFPPNPKKKQPLLKRFKEGCFLVDNQNQKFIMLKKHCFERYSSYVLHV